MQDSKNKPFVLISMDGVGIAEPGPGNAVNTAQTPNLDKLWASYPHAYLRASGLYVGLPENVDGNSEAGHMTMGGGKIILQDLPRINNAIKNDTFFNNPILKVAYSHVRDHNLNLHLIGLTGEGFVHSSVEHLSKLLELAQKEKINQNKVFIHCITDGRDSPPKNAEKTLRKVQHFCADFKVGRIASLIGRFYAMDRNRQWTRTKKAYDMYVNGVGSKITDWENYLKSSYEKKIYDEYLEPALLVTNESSEPNIVRESDVVIFFNYRPDRALQLTRAFEDDNFEGWERPKKDFYFTGFTDYKAGFPKRKIFPPEKIVKPLSKVLSDNGLKQLHIAESEKFAHVTYFFNGGNGIKYPNEEWIQIQSPQDVSSYDLKPEMSQDLVTDELLKHIESDSYDFYVINFASPDMVGHTGNIQAALLALQSCDFNIGRIVSSVLKKNGVVIVTADHGNAEQMLNKFTGEPETKHTTNLVPFVYARNDLEVSELPIASLADVAPTILAEFNIEKPVDMTGVDLLSRIR